jgi:hypothetical protein
MFDLDENKPIIIDNFAKSFKENEQDIFRLLSISLTHGTPIKFIVEQ